ncbi:MAG: DHH family phosphoesterase [Bacteroidales bacterium]|jgi:single-stranded-DNA-specific exonuclease|nr:DHH family phosphoesterase [Bacteroidales bacterium]
MQKRWILRTPPDNHLVNKLSGELHISEDLAYLLVQRGVKTYDEARSFFKPVLEDIHNPYLMQDMQKSVERVEQAIKDKEKILVFGDYDVDGTSAVALVYSFLKTIAQEHEIEYYIPDRYGEGYGISMRAIEYAKEKGFSLIISLDCGIKCHEEIDLAVTYGIDVIVCDHHLPDKTLPKACAVLDPKREDCSYPYKELSGCGVGFKLVHAIAQNRMIPLKELGKYFDLVALSIASDIVPITGENRVFAYFGLRLINERPRQAIESLLGFGSIVRKTPDQTLPPEKTAVKTVFVREITINDLVFAVGPRINAAGRMDTGRSSVHLLVTNEITEITTLGERVDMNNKERRELDAKTTGEAIDMVSAEFDLQSKKSLVVYNPSWSKGVIGIVASRLVEQFYKPTIVLTFFNDIITGSARSVKDFDLYIALSQCDDLLEHFGGHTFAAGLSLKPEKLNEFSERFEQIVSSTISETSIMPTIDIDKEISLDIITMDFFKIAKRFSPFGPGNLSPVFMTKNVFDTGYARIVGQNHLKLSLFQKYNGNYSIDAIAFGLGEHYDRISKGEPFHICYSIDLNEWQGKSSLQLNIKDIRFDFNQA